MSYWSPIIAMSAMNLWAAWEQPEWPMRLVFVCYAISTILLGVAGASRG